MVTAVVMVGHVQQGSSGLGEWVQGARVAATRDLLEQLHRQPQIKQIVLVSPESGLAGNPAVDYFLKSQAGAVHVGETLAALVASQRIGRLLYMGGGSAPLLSDEALTSVVTQLRSAEEMVITNNQYASDWAAVVPATVIADWTERLPRDNMLGWVLSAEAGLPVQALGASAGTRLDIDTPLDLLTLRLHGGTRPHLRRYLQKLPLNSSPLEAALAELARPASQIFLSGRLGPEVWQALNRVTRSWLRVVSEERGMVSSGRQKRGEVRSLVAAQMEAVGMKRFFEMLAEWADAAFIDTRVLLAHHRLWPDEATRFASDMGWVEQVEDEWLRSLTAAAVAAPIPIILGGHGLMAGDMYALCEIIAEWK